MQSWKVKILTYLNGAWAYRWYALAAAWAICLVGWVAIAALPDKYQASAKVYIDTESLMGPLLRGLTVKTDPNQQVSIMLNTLITRPNLEQVVRLTQPGADKYSARQMESEIDEMRRGVRITPLSTKNLFTISYTTDSSANAERVTQTLLSILVNSNIGDKRRDTENAQTFIDKQIEEYQGMLRQAEKRRADFKTANMELNLKGGGATRLTTANADYEKTKQDYSGAVAKRDALRVQLRATPATLPFDDAMLAAREGNGGETRIGVAALRGSPVQRLAQAKQQLADLRLKFTDQHPDVVAMQKTIAQLQEQIASSPKTANSGATNGVPNPLYVQLRTKLADEEMNVALQRRRLDDASKELASAKSMMGDSLTIERQQADLDRDYEVLSNNYQALVKSREAARMAQAVDDQQSSISFRVVEPPTRSQFPVSPYRLSLNSLVLFGGLLGGAAIAFLLSLNAGRFVVSDDLSTQFGIPLIGVVTRLHKSPDTKRFAFSALALSSGVALLLVCYVGVVVLFKTSIYQVIGA